MEGRWKKNTIISNQIERLWSRYYLGLAQYYLDSEVGCWIGNETSFACLGQFVLYIH